MAQLYSDLLANEGEFEDRFGDHRDKKEWITENPKREGIGTRDISVSIHWVLRLTLAGKRNIGYCCPERDVAVEYGFGEGNDVDAGERIWHGGFPAKR